MAPYGKLTIIKKMPFQGRENWRTFSESNFNIKISRYKFTNVERIVYHFRK